VPTRAEPVTPCSARTTPAHMSEWPTATLGVIAVGALGAAAVMISPVTPWMDGVIVFGLELLVPAVAVLLLWFVRNQRP
jgi:hypothetical protein